jgi:bifunctional ADP-heptose synthase (sugar kinase/adenylyltransferase)
MSVLLSVSLKSLLLNIDSSYETKTSLDNGGKHKSKNVAEHAENLKKTSRSDSDEKSSRSEIKDVQTQSLSLVRCEKLIDTRVDRVYTIGCFDLSHHGHVVLFERMRQLGKTLVVGVHDSRR